MAQKAAKDLARSNTAALNYLHAIGLIINAAFLLLRLVRSAAGRPSLLLYLVLSTPSFLCQFTLERTGRPSRHPATGALRPGNDLAAAGLTEYMFDAIWITWGSLVLVALFGDRGWLLWGIVPAFAAYKGVGLVRMARQMVGRGGVAGAAGQGEGQAAAPPPPGNRRQRRAAA